MIKKLFLLFLIIYIIYYMYNYFITEKRPYTMSTFYELKGYNHLLDDQLNWNYTPGGIPKIIIKTGRFKRDSFPDTIKDIFIDLINKNPEYELYYFDNDECDQFIKDYGVFNYYDKLIPGAFKADLFRVCLLEKYGGCYSDLSQIIVVPLNDILEGYNLILVKDWHIFKKGIFNSFMCTIPNCIFFKEIINTIINNIKNEYYGEDHLDITGPRVVAKIYCSYFEKNKKCKIKLNDNIYDNIKIKILNHKRSLYDKLNYGCCLITYNNKRLIDTKFRNYKYITYKSANIPGYPELWKKRKVYKN